MPTVTTSGATPEEITMSSHVRLGSGGEAGPAMVTATAPGGLGLDGWGPAE